jgi:hypothetical protein
MIENRLMVGGAVVVGGSVGIMVGGSVGLVLSLEKTIEKVVTVPITNSTNIAILSFQRLLEVPPTLLAFACRLQCSVYLH